MANKLAQCGSPYLQQHAHNPVDWYPWGEQAFQRALKEDKPLLISIGYATCHWCHVMERESFEDEETAAMMNAHFICIKVDREEHPEVDQLYMDACQLVSGNGGWPLNCFALPDKKPFFAGTYYPPVPMHKRPSWKQVLAHMHEMWTNKRELVEDQASRLTQLIAQGDRRWMGEPVIWGSGVPTDELRFVLADALGNLEYKLDKLNGGLDGAPKFPMFNTMQLLLEAGYFFKEEKWSQYALNWGLKMIRGGIYDQIGGGICRYSTDNEWFLPHFEKMLYDNGAFLQVCSQLYKVFPLEEVKDAIEQTISFLLREMKGDNGLYFAALDADSEGVEGKFYVWDYDEMAGIFGENHQTILAYYDVRPSGNWEGNSILNRTMSPSEFALSLNVEPEKWKIKVNESHKMLLAVRETRPRPLRDEKQILSWNITLLRGFMAWYSASGSSSVLTEAKSLMAAILDTFCDADGRLKRVKIGEKVFHKANLDDYAYLIQASLELYSFTCDFQYWTMAQQWLRIIELNFSQKENVLFAYTSTDNEDVFIRKEDIFDNTMPSANGVMLDNYLRIYSLTSENQYFEKAIQMASAMINAVKKHPASLSFWACGLMKLTFGYYTIKAEDQASKSLWNEIQKLYLPDCIYNPGLQSHKTMAHIEKGLQICSDVACMPAIFSLNEFLHVKGIEP